MNYKFQATWYSKADDFLAGEAELETTSEEIRQIFGLTESDSLDVLEANAEQLKWLETKTSATLDPERFDIFVEVFDKDEED